MANTYQKCRIQLRTDAPTTWSQNNTVLAVGEIGLVKSGQNYDFVVGDGSTGYNNLKKVIGENPVITNLSSTVQSYTSRINSLQENVTLLGQNVATDRGNFNLELTNNYTTSKKMLDEHIPGTDIEKRREIGNWAEWIASDVYPEHRLTDGVSWDSIFIILKSLKEAGILPINDEDAFNFGERLKQYLADLNNMHETEGRGALDVYRDGLLG